MNYKYIIGIILIFLLSNCERNMKLVNNQEYQLIWEENFMSVLDTSLWNIEVKEAGWVNNELQSYTSNKQNLYIKDEKLHIKAIKMDNNNYTSSRITTFQKKKWKYGYFEIKAMLDKKQGTWPAIWLLSETIIEEGWPQCGEIDIMEHINVEDQIYGSLHSKEYNHMKGNNLGHSHSVNNVEDFNIYGLEWQHDRINWYVNDSLFYSINRNEYFAKEWPYDKDYFMIINLAIGGDWPGPPLNDFLSSLFVIDWIKVYE